MRPELHPDAPEIVLIGRGHRREMARDLRRDMLLLCGQRFPCAVFLQREPDVWDFRGNFVVARWSESD